MMHTFEMSGLGRSPFKLIGTPGSKMLRGYGQLFCCQHCGTILQHQWLVESSDGVMSVVGVDCVKKTGDAGLWDGVLRHRREVNSETRTSKQMEKAKARHAKPTAKAPGHVSVFAALIISIIIYSP